MSFARPAANAAKLQFGDAFVRPAADAAALSFAADSFVGAGAATLELIATAAGRHGVAGSGAATLDLAAAAAGEHLAIDVRGAGQALLGVAAAATGAHGIAGAGVVALALSAGATGGHGVAGPGAGVLDVVGAGAGAHGVAGQASGGLALLAAGVAVHERYEVRGTVSVGGVLVNRRVRVYARDSGELAGEADTVAGRFQVHTGFAPAEHYLISIDLADDAADWAPPTANRVLSVLAQDAA